MLKVKVCCGTSCYIMGASELINSDVGSDPGVEIQGSTCLNFCKDGNKRPPYVTINNEVYSQVTLSRFESLIKEKLGALQ